MCPLPKRTASSFAKSLAEGVTFPMVLDMAQAANQAIALYLANEVAVTDLWDMLPDGWEMDQAGNEEERQLVLQVMGNLSEYQRGDLDEEALRARFAALIA